MKKLLLLLSLLVLCPCAAQANDFSDKMLELFKSPNQTVRLGSMLMLAEAADVDALVEYVRASLNNSDSDLERPAVEGLAVEGSVAWSPVVERTVKLYFLARNENDLDHKDLLNFISSFPEDPQDFVEVLQFDSSISLASPSGQMLLSLDNWASCQMREDVRLAARKKIERLRKTQLASGWSAEIFPEAFEHCPRP